MKLHIILCRHSGVFGSLIRKITGNDYDHVSLKIKDSTIYDFNFPDGMDLYAPWEWDATPFELYHVCLEAEINMNEFMSCQRIVKNTFRYSLLINLNYLLNKWGFKFRIRDDKQYIFNCVTYVLYIVSKCKGFEKLDTEPLKWLSPQELVHKLIKYQKENSI